MHSLFLLVALALTANAGFIDPDQTPQIRHTPEQPKPGDVVLVTAKLPAGVTSASLKLQAVAPGKYIRKSDPAFQTDWVELRMHDDGIDGDAKKGDGTFSIRVPAKYQKHRYLVRYVVETVDQEGNEYEYPFDEDCPNYAWWCDAGPAAWTGSREPGKLPNETFSTEFLKTLQSLQLIARSEDVAKSQWDGNFHKQKQQGTIVYQGHVYDHITYTNRGQGSAHISGKNKWNLKFQHSDELPFVDHDGIPFPQTCDSLSLNPGGSTPYIPVLRGITGLDEVMSMRAYRIAGVPSPPVTWVQWRVVDRVDEVSAKDQYSGDLWGVYVALGELKPSMMADKKLPDGLVVSMQSGIKHTPRGMTDGQKVWETFINGARSNPKETWWRTNLDLPTYFSFHAMNRLLANVDIRPDGNHGYYRHPNGKWQPIPWDNDMMFVPRHHQPGYIDAAGCLQHTSIVLEYRNRAREILDLFASDATPHGGQVGQLVRDLGQAITPKGYPTDWAKLDAAVWNQHPRMNQKGSYFVNPASGSHFGGGWTRTLATNDFAGFEKYLIDFCTDTRPTKKYAPNDGNPLGYGWGYLALEAKDDKIPKTPIVTQKPNAPRQFEASVFESSANQKQAALEWRVGRIGQVGEYELTELWRSESPNATSMTIPAAVFKAPGEYRVRARWRDDTGRCSHWSAPVTMRTGQ